MRSLAQPLASVDTGAGLGGLRPILLSLILLLSWIGVEPFPDLTSDSLLDPDKAAGSLNMVAYLGLGAAAFAAILMTKPAALRLIFGPLTLLALGWLLVATITSQDPGLSSRRLVLTAIIMLLAGGMIVLPQSLRQFAGLLAGAALFVLALCFAGIYFAPHFSVHQVSDAAEPKLAGDWRGLFAHKNVAASMMVIFIFVGIFVSRALERTLGTLIIALAALFLWQTAGKTSLGILPLALVLAWIFHATRNQVVRYAIVIIPVVLLNLATIGSVALPWVAQINHLVLPDASFTGRTDIWQFALQKVQQRPWLGYGYQAFWQTSSTRFGANDTGDVSEQALDESATTADHAHNAYLDVALTTGLPGLVLTIAWLVFYPLRAFARARDNGAPPELLLFFTQIWLFSINFACLESLYFNRTDPAWLMLLVSIFGVTVLTRYRITRSSVGVPSGSVV